MHPETKAILKSIGRKVALVLLILGGLVGTLGTLGCDTPAPGCGTASATCAGGVVNSAP